MVTPIAPRDRRDCESFVVDGLERTAQELATLFRPGTHELGSSQPRFRQAGELVAQVCDDGFIVDVGCYAGTFLEMLRKRLPQARCEGIDADAENIRIARRLYPQFAHAFRHASAYALPLDDASVDCVTFLEVIEHIDRPVDAVRELNRVLRSGGHLVLSTPNGVSMQHVLRTIGRGYKNVVFRWLQRQPTMSTTVFSVEEWNRHLIEFSHGSLHNVLAMNGFELVEHRFIPAGERRKAVDALVPGLAGAQIVLVRKTGAPPDGII